MQWYRGNQKPECKYFREERYAVAVVGAGPSGLSPAAAFKG